MYQSAPSSQHAPYAHHPASTMRGPHRHPTGPTPPLPQRPTSCLSPDFAGQAPPRLPHRPPTWNAQAAPIANGPPDQYLPQLPTHAPMNLEQDFARMSMAPPAQVPMRAASPAATMGPPTPINPWAGQRDGGQVHADRQYQHHPSQHAPQHNTLAHIPPPYTNFGVPPPAAPIPHRTSSYGAPSAISRGPYNVQSTAPVPPLPSDLPPPTRHHSMPTSSSSLHRLSGQSSAASSASGASSSTVPPVVAPLPTVEGLQRTRADLDRWQDGEKLTWAEDVLRIVDRRLNPGGSPTEMPAANGADGGSVKIELPFEVNELLGAAVPIIISTTSHPSSALSSTALYLRAKLLSTGACPDLLPKDQRQAFRDFEAAAKSGEARAWFRLGRDYEGFGDLGRARECFEKGKGKGDCECTYRMGMANLLGQLLLSPDPAAALPLLERAASLSSTDVPQPSYVYGMLLASELSTPVPIPSSFILPPTQDPSDPLLAQWATAREAIEHAAYLGLAPAQAKCGYFYEHAALGSVYDPLMSVQWYSLASQQGDTDSDMSLSKWFLCGAEGHFGKNEELARTFAEKAARKGHPNGCFAMGYYYELGIGGRQDHDQAKKWYQRASKLDNADAKARLAALNSANPHALSLSEHQSKLNETLVRRHTQAKIRSDRSSIRRPAGRGAASHGRAEAARIDAAARAAAAAPSVGAPIGVGQVFSPNPSGGLGPNGQMPPAQRYPSATLAPGQAYNIPHSGSNGHLNGAMQNRPSRPQISIPGPGSGVGGRRPSNGAVSPRDASINMNSQTGGGGVRAQRGFTLTDGPPVTMGPGSMGGMRHSGSTTSLNGSMQTPAQEAKAKVPQTFAEMGFQSKPVEEDQCVIM